MILTDHKILLENWNSWQRSGSWRIIFSAPTLSAKPSFQKLWERKQTLQLLRRRDGARAGDGGQEVIFDRGSGLTHYADVLHLFLIDPNEKPTKVFIQWPKTVFQKGDKRNNLTETRRENGSSPFVWQEERSRIMPVFGVTTSSSLPYVATNELNK